MHDRSDGDLAARLLAEAQRAVGKRLRTLRDERDLSERAVADHAGVHQSTWSRVEAGDVDPRLSWLLRAQQLFGVESLESLFGLSPSQRLLESDVTTSRGETNSPET